MRRRALLCTLSAGGLAGIAGCGGRSLFDWGDARGRDVGSDGDDGSDASDAGGASPVASSTPPPTAAPTDPENAQWLSVQNTRPESVYVTAVAESDGETFVGSADLFPGDEPRFFASIPAGGRYDVVVETAAGERATYEWDADSRLDGLSTYVTNGGIAFRRHVDCRGACEFVSELETVDLPILGSGTGRWYSPAGVVLRNPTSGAKTAKLDVSLDGDGVLSGRYRVLAETELEVPLSYRSGTFRVAVDVDGRRSVGEWPVPAVPQFHAVLDSSVRFGCGPSNTAMRLSNQDNRAHELGVVVRRDGERRFGESFTVDAGETRTIQPVTASGRYDVAVETGDGARATAAWWSCSPHGPMTVLVDATGAVSLRQTSPQPG